MFKLALSPTYTWPVALEVAAEEGGKRQTLTFHGKFLRLPQERIDEIIKTGLPDLDLCKEVFVGWSGPVFDEDFVFSEVNRDKLLGIAGMRTAVALAWMDSLPQASRKN